MKKVLTLAVMLAFAQFIFADGTSFAKKMEQRILHIYKEANLTKDEKTKVKSVLQAFLTDIHTNKKRHDDVKDKYKDAIEKNKLSAAAADEIMESKFKKDENDIKIRRQYYPRFKQIVGSVKAREILKASDDKISDAKKK